MNKMGVELGDPVDYYLRLDDTAIHLNPYIGQRIQLIHHGAIQCQHCGGATRKSYSGGYCYPCFKKLAQCDLCIVSPERCHYDQGTCREPEWAQTFCMQEHIVYLANSSGIKVGLTKPNQIPTRWIDQGAVQALEIFRVDTRQLAGFVEVAFKDHISDKTHWQKMLQAEDRLIDLAQIRDDLLHETMESIDQLRFRFGGKSIREVSDAEVQVIRYPVERYPTKVVAMNFDKTPTVEGLLLGIKGQYLIFDTGVINLRRYTSYEIELVPLGEGASSGESLSLF